MNGSVRGVIALFCRAVAPALVLLLVIGIGPNTRAQSSSDVHIVPQSPSTPVVNAETGMPNSAAQATKPEISVEVDLVLVPVVVTDSANRPVTGLKKSEFNLYENEKQQPIRYFSSEDEPISVGIVLDLSGTMSRRADAAREALREFFRNSNSSDDYFVITFADRPQLIADSTSSPEEIEERLSGVTPSGHTALLDAVHLGLQKLRSARYERRALLVISDGEDNWSRLKSREVAAEIEESGDYVYSIGLFSDEVPILSSLEVASGKRLLTKMSEAGGGRAIMVNDLQNLPAAAAAIGKEMRNQYVLGYRPETALHMGERRKIKVSVASPGPAAPHEPPLHLAYKRAYSAPLN